MIALLRTEMTKAARRTRTWVIGLVLIGLPTLIVVAINARRNRPRGDNGEGLFRLAQQSGFLVPAAVLSALSGFLLVIIAGTIAGDSVASDASWGNLRYLLMRPVPRGRLVVAKAIVAGALIWLATFVVTLAALVVGLAFFGSHAVTVPTVVNATTNAITTFQLGSSGLLGRVLLATAYVAFGYTGLLAIGTFFSTLTDTATGAIAATVGVYIISEILDGIDQLGELRYGFPTHYLDAWQAMFLQNQFSSDMIAGIVVQLAYLAVFGAAAVIWFRRKDIRS